jgi:hypothetical protein
MEGHLIDKQIGFENERLAIWGRDVMDLPPPLLLDGSWSVHLNC